MSTLSFKVLDRKNQSLCTLTGIDSKATIQELMMGIAGESDYLKKKGNYDINRMRLTVGDAKGRALADKRVSLAAFFTSDEQKKEITLVFKDLGP